MSIKKPEFIIDPDDVFAGDRLNRREEVLNVSKLIVNLPSPLTISVSSAWGTGKTAFSRMLQGHLQSENRHALYFSAWETDFASDPLTAFLGEMNDQLAELLNESEVKSKAWEKAKTAGGYLAKKLIPLAVRLGTAGVLSGDIEKEFAELTGNISDEAVDLYLKEKSKIFQFKEAISEIVGQGEDAIYIFVDELDRCRPDYAIALLERIKHLFSIPGITFVLSMDKIQLGHSITALYGQNFDAQGYLRRFVDLEYNLRVPEPSTYVTHLLEVLNLEDFFNKRHHASTAFAHDRDAVISSLDLIAKACDLSLRDTEQFLSRFKLVAYALGDRSNLYPQFLIYLIYLKTYKPSLLRYTSPYQLRRQLTEELKEIALKSGDKYNRIAAAIEAHIVTLLVEDEFEFDRALLDAHRGREQSDNEPAASREYSSVVAGIANYLTQRGQRGVPYKIVESRVAMLSEFNFDV